MRVVDAIASILISLVGLLCVIDPAKVQRFVLRQKSDGIAWRLNPFVPFMETSFYRICVRVLGVILILFGSFGLYGFWRRF